MLVTRGGSSSFRRPSDFTVEANSANRRKRMSTRSARSFGRCNGTLESGDVSRWHLTERLAQLDLVAFPDLELELLWSLEDDHDRRAEPVCVRPCEMEETYQKPPISSPGRSGWPLSSLDARAYVASSKVPAFVGLSLRFVRKSCGREVAAVAVDELCRN